jgi:hypothetical protein
MAPDAEAVWKNVWTYCTSLFGIDEDRHHPFARYLGSGTFVGFRGAPCVLTAAHVWKVLARYRGVGFATVKDVNLLKVPKEALRPLAVSNAKDEEWGPDIALVRLEEVTRKRLEVRKAFYDLQKTRSLTDSAEKRWILTGATAEGSQLESDEEALLKNWQLASSEAAVSIHDGQEYVDVPWTVPETEVPKSWGGLSGAGLWRVDTQANGEPILEGLAYLERRPHEDRPGFIRCHSRRSIDDYLETVDPHAGKA